MDLLNILVVHVCVDDRPSRSPHELFRTQGFSHRAYCCTILLLSVPFVHVCVDRHSRSSADQHIRAQGFAHTRYYCCTFSIIHVETCSCSVVSGAVLRKTHIFSFFYCERGELLICRVHQFGLERIKSSALYGGCWIFPAIKKNVGENRGEMEISLVAQDAAHKGFC